MSAQPRSESGSQLGPDEANDDRANTELNGAIDDLLDNLSNKFTTVTEEIMKKMEQMSERLDNLEAAMQASRGEES